MSLTFGGANSDRVDHGAINVLDDAAAWTVTAWVYATTLTSGRRIYSKGANAFLRLSGTTGNLQVYRSRDTTAANFITNTTPLATGAWTFVAATYDASANPTGRIYTGTLAASAVEAAYGTAANGSGTITGANSDAADNVMIGNFTGATAAFRGDIASAGMWTRALTLAEIIEQQWRRRPTANCVLFTEYGWNNTGAQPDWSGSGNAGAITGATLTTTHVPVRPLFIGGVVFAPSDVPAAGGVTATLTGGAAFLSLGITGAAALTPVRTAAGGAALLSLGASGAGTVAWPTATVAGGAAVLSLGVSGTVSALADLTASGGAAFLSLSATGTADVQPSRSAAGVVPLLSLGVTGTGVISAYPDRNLTGTVPLPTLGVASSATLEPMATVSGGAAFCSLGVTGAGTVAWPALDASGSVAFVGLSATGSIETWQPLSATGIIGLCSLAVVAQANQWLPLTATASVALPTVSIAGTGTIGAATYCILDDIATLLAPAVSWPVYKGLMPDTADGGQAIGVYERGGEPMLWGVNVDLPVIGVLVRGKSMAQASTAYQAARDMAETVVRTLHDTGPTTVNGRDYYAILSRDEPAYEGEDERQRPAFSCSFAVTAAAT